MITWAGLLFSSLAAKTIFETLNPHGTFFMYAALSAIGTIYYFFYLHEMKGKSEL